jgi:superfamily I DNA/RNA helicase
MRSQSQRWVKSPVLVSMDSQELQKVTISTCHAAKGLEWPVVFIPSGMCHMSQSIIRLNDCQVEEGTFPFYRTDDIEEERYVTLAFHSYANLIFNNVDDCFTLPVNLILCTSL